MKENKIIIVIDRPIEEVFKFTTNPENTPLWIPSIEEEIAEEYPPKVDTIYKNRGKNSEWDYYKVLEIKKNKIFLLTDLDKNYHVRYTYRKLDDNQTEMEYFEWMVEGELSNPFTKEILENLKSNIESTK